MEEIEIYKNRILELEKENDKLKDNLLDATTQLNYSKENELLDFIKTLYREICEEINEKESPISREKLLKNIKIYLKEFAKNNKINL
jgi:hypothetical protein